MEEKCPTLEKFKTIEVVVDKPGKATKEQNNVENQTKSEMIVAPIPVNFDITDLVKESPTTIKKFRRSSS